jgi:hypothetical protein
MIHFRFVAVVWGTDFTEAFQNVCLPSFLTPGNLGFVAQNTDSLFQIYTTPQDRKTICQSPAYRRLSAIMPVEIAEIRGLSLFPKYQVMTQSHAHFIRSAQGDDCPLVFVSPDIVLADGSLTRLLEVAESGKRLVAMGAVRLVKETFVPAYLQQYRRDGIVQPIAPRELVKLALEHLHPITKSMLWNPDGDSETTPLDLLWAVGQEGLILRQFHPCPLMVWPIDKDAVPIHTVDADYTCKAVPNPADVYVVQDSDDICLMDFTSLSQAEQLNAHGGGHSMENVAEWARRNTHDIHRECVKYNIRLHWTDCSEKWRKVEEQADSVVGEILSLTEATGKQSEPMHFSRMRYFSPGFLIGKLMEKGIVAFLKQIFNRVALPVICWLYGGSIRISRADRSKTP